MLFLLIMTPIRAKMEENWDLDWGFLEFTTIWECSLTQFLR